MRYTNHADFFMETRAGINTRIPVSLEFMRLTGIFLYPLGTVWVQTPYSGEIFACDL